MIKRLKAKRNPGFTLVELIVVITIIGVLSAVVIVRFAGKTDQAKVAAAKSQVNQIANAVQEFKDTCNRLPRSLDELVNKPSDCPNFPENGYLKGKKAPKDPWNHDYVFKVEGSKYDVISLGADGKEGGSGLDSDLSFENADANTK